MFHITLLLRVVLPMLINALAYGSMWSCEDWFTFELDDSSELCSGLESWNFLIHHLILERRFLDLVFGFFDYPSSFDDIPFGNESEASFKLTVC